MALLKRRTERTSRRAVRRTHTRTLKARAQAERKFQETAAKKAAKVQAKADKAAAKADKAAAKTAGKRTRKKAGTEATHAESTSTKATSTRGSAAATARSYLLVARVVAPVLAPFAYRAAASLRGRLDATRARRIGVAVEQLGEFSGHGAALSARIAGLEPALAEMTRTQVNADSAAFRESTVARLAELSTAVHASERMPTPRRKAAHRAIGDDLDRIDAEVLHRLGVR